MNARYGMRIGLIALLVAVILQVALFDSQLVRAQDSSQGSGPDIAVRLHYGRAGGIYDPAYWQYTSDWFIYPTIFNWLIRWVPGSGGSELEPDLAESYELSSDGLHYTFHLRSGVQFHDGYGELTADDVVFSYQRQIDDADASFNQDLSNVESVTALDELTVRITLREPQPSFLPMVVAYRPGIIVSRAAVEERGAEFASRPIGTGPFILRGINEADEVITVAHTEYFQGAPPVSSIRFVHVGEEAVVAAALMSGELHFIQTRGNPEVVEQLLNNPEIRVERRIQYDNLLQVQFSPRFEPTQNVLVRRAMAHAIDRDLFMQALPGLDEAAYVARPDTMYGGVSLDEVPTYPYEPATAIQLLAEAGYPDGFTVRLMHATSATEATIAAILAENWRAIGLDVIEEPTELTAAFDRRNTGEFDVTFSATARPGDPDLLFSNVFHSSGTPPGGSNYIGYSAVDDLIDAARVELDPDVRADLYRQAQAQVMTDLPIIPLVYRAFAAAWRDPIESMVPGVVNNFWGGTIRVR